MDMTRPQEDKDQQRDFYGTYRTEIARIGRIAEQANLSGGEVPKEYLSTGVIFRSGKRFEVSLEAILANIPLSDGQMQRATSLIRENPGYALSDYTGELEFDGAKASVCRVVIVRNNGSKIWYIPPEGMLLDAARVGIPSDPKCRPIVAEYNTSSRFDSSGQLSAAR